jgi:hypothetical protein
VERNYAAANLYAERIVACIDRLRTPLAQQMRERGLERARQFARDRWQVNFAVFVEQIVAQPARPGVSDVRIEPLRTELHVAGVPTLLLPVRFMNLGTRLGIGTGPGRTVVCVEIRSDNNEEVVLPCAEMPLPLLVMPGQAQVAAVPIEVPAAEGAYRVRMWTESWDGSCSAPAEIALHVEAEAETTTTCASVFLDAVTRTLPTAHQMQQLPVDYVDVTEGAFASVKRLLKRKVLHNFKHAYLDVLSRQQSHMNGHLVLMIQQLAECCALLEQRLATLENANFHAPSTGEAETAVPIRRRHG